MKTKFEWKKKWLDDRSGYWYSAKIPIIGWEYIVETLYTESIVAGMYYSRFDDEITNISKKRFKSEQEAKTACEKHLQDTYKKFKTWIQTTTYEA